MVVSRHLSIGMKTVALASALLIGAGTGPLLLGADDAARSVGWVRHDIGRGIRHGWIAGDPSSSLVYAASDAGTDTPTGVLLSTDGGSSWAVVNGSLPEKEIRGLVVDPLDPNLVYAALGTQGVYKSEDRGMSWTAAISGLPPNMETTCLHMNPQARLTLLLGLTGGRVFRSTDGADTWTEIATFVGDVTAFASDPTNANVFYAGTSARNVYKTADGGTTWIEMGVDLAGAQGDAISAMVVDPGAPDVIYLSMTSNGVWKSTNGGVTWALRGDGLIDIRINDLVLAVEDPQVLYAATAGNGVFTSTDGGESWQQFATSGLTDRTILGLDLDPADSHHLFAGTPTALFEYRAPSAPIIKKFQASPMSIVLGGSSTLSWNVLHANSCSIKPKIGHVRLKGSKTVTPSVTTTYTLKAIGPVGSATWSLTVSVSPFASFVATPSGILLGASTVLSWSIPNATACSIDNGIGSVLASGSRTVTPVATTVYTLTATGPFGTVTRSVTVTVTAIDSFTASPSLIHLGAGATLTWQTRGDFLVTIDHGVGSVLISGSVVVYPSVATTYTLTATGPGGTVTATATVVIKLPTVTNLTATPNPVQSGSSSAIAFTLSDPDGGALSWTATLLNGGGGSLDVASGTGVASGGTVTIHFTSLAATHAIIQIDVTNQYGATASSSVPVAVQISRSVTGSLTEAAPGQSLFPGLFAPIQFSRISSASSLVVTVSVSGSTFTDLALGLGNFATTTYSPLVPVTNGTTVVTMLNDGTNDAWFGIGVLPSTITSWDSLGIKFSAGTANLSISWVWQ